MTLKEITSLAWELETKHRPVIVALVYGKQMVIVRSKEYNIDLVRMCKNAGVLQ